ncbi:hypothetical protein [Parahaliea aestuarii]|uniref:Uncharacterized protein n=1 Tax=Parahaliea aestuarii TaxID=1852021 RepID=A0A5C8ZPL4_9GAMM|nr:hypothetical protein [Parahaliea aestuarii]TXS89579.1 hypothetical protein FVW59_16295 [Parahaliea aestuarii]
MKQTSNHSDIEFLAKCRNRNCNERFMTTNLDPKSQVCGDSCKAAVEDAKMQRAESLWQPRICVQCHAEYQPMTNTAKYCGKVCRDAAIRGRYHNRQGELADSSKQVQDARLAAERLMTPMAEATTVEALEAAHSAAEAAATGHLRSFMQSCQQRLLRGDSERAAAGFIAAVAETQAAILAQLGATR